MSVLARMLRWLPFISLAAMFCSTALYVDAANADPKQAMTEAQQAEANNRTSDAIHAYKKANKAAGERCVECLVHLTELYRKQGDDKKSAEAAAQLATVVTAPKDKAEASILEGAALVREGTQRNDKKLYAQADAQFKQALQLNPASTNALFFDGVALGRMGHDAEAHDAFTKYLAADGQDPDLRAKASAYLSDPDLVRAQMAPLFSIRTSNGTVLKLADLHGKVVLLDFWATWCGPCNAELPHLQRIVQEMQGKPLVVISISLDEDEAKWRAFIAKDNMTWPQYLDAGKGMARAYAASSIPHYYIIDGEGRLRSSDMNRHIEGKLAHLIAEMQSPKLTAIN